MRDVVAILLAAGRGLRFKSRIGKPLAKIRGKPVIVYSLETLSRHPAIRDIVVVVNSKNSEEIKRKIREYRIDKVTRIVRGGRRRQDSVYNGLKATSASDSFILIHDSARPFITHRIITALIKEARLSKAAIAGVPVKSTIKEAICLPGGRPPKVKRTLERNALWEIQTPQVFKRGLIISAYKRYARQEVTDDASLVEKTGYKARIVLGSYKNIKITTPEDLITAGLIAVKFNRV